MHRKTEEQIREIMRQDREVALLEEIEKFCQPEVYNLGILTEKEIANHCYKEWGIPAELVLDEFEKRVNGEGNSYSTYDCIVAAYYRS